MVATFVQDALVAELKKLFTGFPLKTQTGETTDFNVFPQYLPIPKPVEPPEGDLDQAAVQEGLAASDVGVSPDPFPYIIVRVEEGKIEDIDGTQSLECYILIGVFDDEYDNQGYKDVLNTIQRIYERFSKNAILADRYECRMPIDWLLQEEESYPYYFGGMTLNFLTHPIRREDPYA